MEKTITILLDRLEEKTITINQLKEDLRHYESLEVPKTGNIVEQLKRDYNTIAQRCNELEVQNEALINGESKTILMLNEELCRKSERITELTNELDAANERIAQLDDFGSKAVGDATNEIAELEADIEAKDNYIAQLEAKVDDFRKQIASQPVSNSKGKPGNPNLNADICKGAGYLIYRECEDSREPGRIFLEFHYEDELASLSKYIGGAKGWNVKAKHACFNESLINGWSIRRASYDESSMCYDFLDKDGKSFQRLDTVALNIL